MSEMVERVAREIYKADEPWAEAFPWPELPVMHKAGADGYRNFARVAIEAMREPTVDMVNSGYDVGYSPDPLPTELVWRAMIDAALSKAKPSQGDGNE